MLVNNTEPFFFPGNQVGCLLIHGFTGAPTEMRPLGEYLAELGLTVMGVRLAGHGTAIEDMNRVRWKDWSASVLDGWYMLSDAVDEVYLIGLSMGGALALYHASFLPASGVVALSAPYQVGSDPRLPLLPLISRVYPYMAKGKSDWQDQDAMEEHFSYDKYPTRAILQLTQLLEELRISLPAITMPALLMHSVKDAGVPHGNMDLIYQALGTPEEQKTKITLKKSGHVLTRDLEKDFVFSEIHQFIERNSKVT
jgi:carboxylesterase